MLADKYYLEHLKEWCEVYLSNQEVVNIQNIVDLYIVANTYNAPQLKAVCGFQMRQIMDVVKEMEEWKNMPENLKAEFLKHVGTLK